MKKKSAKVVKFIEGLHEYITTDEQFRTKTHTRREREIQAEIRPLILYYLAKYYDDAGFKDPWAKANKSFYWEGQQGPLQKTRDKTFGTKNYPDFIITEPYRIAIEYKKSDSGSTIKHGIGQSIMHTLCEEFHYVYFLFHDESKNKSIQKSFNNKRENFILDKMWKDFNVMVRNTQKPSDSKSARRVTRKKKDLKKPLPVQAS